MCKFSVYIVVRVEMKFLHYMCGGWEFPKIEYTKIVNAKYVLMGPCTPSHIKKKGYIFKEDDVALGKYKTIKMRNRILSTTGHQQNCNSLLQFVVIYVNIFRNSDSLYIQEHSIFKGFLYSKLPHLGSMNVV